MFDNAHMAQALRLAQRGLYTTEPNPRVGCVIAQGADVVGEGWHQTAGGPHAEIHALNSAGERARGADCFVTLEPCSHHGRTPPCAEALIKAGVKRVVAAMADPNPLVGGAGLQLLEQAGIDVEVGVMEDQARQLNPGFIQRMEQGRPFVRCKLAMSLDGRTAMSSGESKWITGADARADVQRLRARSAAIMTGIGTVLADDPSLTVRWDGFTDLPDGAEYHQPLRVIVDPRLSIPLDARLLQAPGRTLIATSSDDREQAELLETDRVAVARMEGSNHAVDLPVLLKHLANLEVNEVLLETGATLSGAMLQAGLIDELVVYIAPTLMGDDARGLFRLPGLAQMQDKLGLNISDVRAVGHDWRITATVEEK